MFIEDITRVLGGKQPKATVGKHNSNNKNNGLW